MRSRLPVLKTVFFSAARQKSDETPFLCSSLVVNVHKFPFLEVPPRTLVCHLIRKTMCQIISKTTPRSFITVLKVEVVELSLKQSFIW